MDQRNLEALAHQVARRGRRQVIVGIVVAFVLASIFQTVLILVAARLTSHEQQRLADRVDRNVSFTACVLLRSATSQQAVRSCLARANARYRTPPTLP